MKMSGKTFLQSSRQASALAITLVVIVLLFTAGLGMLQCGLQARLYANRAANEIAARTAADAGITNAIWKLNRNVKTKYACDNLPALKRRPLTNSPAAYAYEVSVPDSSFFQVETIGDDEQNQDDIFAAKLPFAYRYVIKSVGTSGNAQKTLYATVKLEGLFQYALLSQGKLQLASNTLITGYNSSDPGDTFFDVKIGTTSTEPDAVSLSSGSVVEADVFVGVGGNPEEVIEDGGTVEGSTFALTEQVRFPTITPPPLTYVGTTISARGETVTFDPTDSGTYKKIDLRQKAEVPGVLEIDGGEVVLRIEDGIDLGNDTDIIVRNGASLTLYVDGDISTRNGAGFSNENTPVDTLTIFAIGTDDQLFDLKAKTESFGVVYAPNADLILYSKNKFYGAITAENISIKSKGEFYYDEALRDVGPDDTAVRFVIEKWWE